METSNKDNLKEQKLKEELKEKLKNRSQNMKFKNSGLDLSKLDLEVTNEKMTLALRSFDEDFKLK